MALAATTHFRNAFRRRLAAFLLCLLLPGAGLLAAEDTLRISGSTTLQPLAERLARGFRKTHPDATLNVSGGGSARGLVALMEGRAEIAASSRFISADEVRLSSERGVYPVPFRIAYDCIIPVVHTSNRIRDLSLQQLRDIYSGEIDNWRELGGPDRPILVLSREPDSGTRATWQRLVMGQVPEGTHLRPQASNLDVVRQVARQRGAIGYIGLGYLSASVRPLTVEGVMGSLGSVRDGRYALSRSLYLFTNGWPEGRTLAFIDFVMDPAGGQRSVEKSGFVPLYPSEPRR